MHAIADLRVGSIDDARTALGTVSEIGVLPDGRIVLALRPERLLRLFSADGAPLRDIGRPGPGPGEFQLLSTMGLRGDTIWVHDPAAGRFSYFDPEGELLLTRGYERPQLGSGADGRAIIPEGLLADGSMYGRPGYPGFELAAGMVELLPLVRLDSMGSVTDTILTQRISESLWMIAAPDGGSARLYRDQPFGDADLVDVGGNVPAVVRVDRSSGPPGSVTVVLHDLHGGEIYNASIELPALPLTQSDVQRALDDMVAEFTRSAPGAPPAAIAPPGRLEAWGRASLYAPEYRPPVDAVRIGADGSVWLRQTGARDGLCVWTVLSDQGEGIADVSLPTDLELFWATPTRVYGIETDDLDVPYLVRYEVTR